MSALGGHCLKLSPDLAKMIGLNEAIVLQQLDYWIRLFREQNDPSHFRDGEWWVYNTIEQWRKDNFPFWSESTIRRALESLIEKGLVKRGRYNKFGYDRTFWYAIDHEAISQLDQNKAPVCQEASVQDDNGEPANLDTAIPETTTDYQKLHPEKAELTGEALLDSFDLHGPDWPGRGEPVQTKHWTAQMQDKPWMNCANWLRPRDGIPAESLQHVYWLIARVGLEPTEDEHSGWSKALATIYKAAEGDFGIVERGICATWSRPMQYRPGHAQGFVNEVRKAKSAKDAPQSDGPDLRAQMEADPQYQTFKRLREQRERERAEQQAQA